jgi:hypothetical protein
MKYQMQFVQREDAMRYVERGWHSLLNDVYDEIEKYPHVKVVQVKEKFGGLRVYTDIYEPELDSVIEQLCNKSFYICEVCGDAGNLRSGGWWKTLCDLHADGREPITPF